MPRAVAEMKPFLMPLAVLALTATAADGQRRGDADDAYHDVRAGSIMPLREIEARYLPRMAGAAYLGPEFDSRSSVYRLKFMRSGSVIWIDVDARTGREIGRSGR